MTCSKPIDQRQFIRDTLLDILNNIDVVVEIQEENVKVIEVFDNENTIAALFEYTVVFQYNSRILKLNITRHKEITLNFPQICADIFSCLPDQFVSDIAANDYLMRIFFEIPQNSNDTRYFFIFCQ